MQIIYKPAAFVSHGIVFGAGLLQLEIFNFIPFNLSLGSKKQLFLDDNEFIKVTGVDNNKKLFDGSIIIEFNVLPNFDDFALENGLVFIADLSDINRGVFKIKNLYDLQDKINILEKSSNVLSIDLDLIDISTTNN